MSTLPTYEAFKSQLNQEFSVVYDAAHPAEILSLKDISEVKSIGGGFSSYSMTFSSVLKDGYLMQKQWNMTNDTLGELSLFLVPGGPNGDSFDYHATLTFKQ